MADLQARAITSTQLTIDDFDPLFSYSDYTAWQTPNPQDNPTWWNESSQVTGSVWHQATYHYTDQVGQKVSLEFKGSAISFYGAGGPADTNFRITLDSRAPNPLVREYTTPNATEGRTTLFELEGLNNALHTLEVENLGSGLLVDLVVVTVPVGGEGAELRNVTVQNDDPAIQYSGDWTTQSGPNFNGGTSTYTSGPNNLWQFSFEGSAIYIYGDQVNDHGLYSIYLNGTDPAHLYATNNGRSGCGGGYAKYCEKLHGLTGFIGDLPEGTHQVTLVNEGPAEGNVTFYDFDYIEYTVPTVYPPVDAATYTCPFTNCTDTSTSPSASGSASIGGSATAGASGGSPTQSGASGTVSSAAAASSSGAAGMGMDMGNGAVGLIMGLWAVRSVVGW